MPSLILIFLNGQVHFVGHIQDFSPSSCGRGVSIIGDSEKKKFALKLPIPQFLARLFQSNETISIFLDLFKYEERMNKQILH